MVTYVTGFHLSCMSSAFSPSRWSVLILAKPALVAATTIDTLGSSVFTPVALLILVSYRLIVKSNQRGSCLLSLSLLQNEEKRRKQEDT